MGSHDILVINCGIMKDNRENFSWIFFFFQEVAQEFLDGGKIGGHCQPLLGLAKYVGLEHTPIPASFLYVTSTPKYCVIFLIFFLMQ